MSQPKSSFVRRLATLTACTVLGAATLASTAAQAQQEPKKKDKYVIYLSLSYSGNKAFLNLALDFTDSISQ